MVPEFAIFDLADEYEEHLAVVPLKFGNRRSLFCTFIIFDPPIRATIQTIQSLFMKISAVNE